MNCVGSVSQTIESLEAHGCRFGDKKLRTSAPVFRVLDGPIESLTLVNPSEDGDCGAQMMKMIMVAKGIISPEPRRRILELVKERHMFSPTVLPAYRDSLMPAFGFRYLELWEILLLCEHLQLNPIVVAMSSQRGHNSSHVYMKYSFRFERHPNSQAWPMVIIAMTQDANHYEVVARKLGHGSATPLCFTFAAGAFPMQGRNFIHGGQLNFDDWLMSESTKNQDMTMIADFKPPRGSLLDGSNDVVYMNPSNLHILHDVEDKYVVALSDKGKRDIVAKLRAQGRITNAGTSGAGTSGAKAKAPSATGKKPKTAAPSLHSRKRPRSPSLDRPSEEDRQMAAAIAASMQPTGRESDMTPEEEEEMNMALALSASWQYRGFLYRSRIGRTNISNLKQYFARRR